MLNKTISGYTILRLLGKGGMADVYYAENNLQRPAAIKILHKAMSDMPEVKSRFEHEARIIVRLDHSNIRKVYDVAEIEGQPAMVMEYLDGNTLSEALARHNLPANDLSRLFDQAVSGLKYAHSKGIVHRDIKPSNLFLTSSGELKILDFGIAKVEEASTHTLTGQTLGTILYMSPEQVEDPKRVDYHTDIYSLGVTFYHLITGKPPYDLSTDSSFKIQLKIVRDDLDLSSLSKDWYTRLAPCLKKDANSRYFPEVDLIKTNSYGPSADITIVESGHAIVTGKMDLIDDGSTIFQSGSNPTHHGQQSEDQKGSRQILWGVIIFIGLILGAFVFYLVANKDDNPYQENEKYLGQFSDKELSLEYDYSKRLNNGNLIVAIGGEPQEAYRANGFREYEGGKWGILSPTGKILFSMYCDYIVSSEFDELLEIVKESGIGLVSTNGKLFLKPTYGYFHKTESGLIELSLNAKVGIMSRSGNTIFPPEYDQIEDYGKDGFLLVSKNVKKYVRSSGELILDVSEYECTDDIKGNYIIVCGKNDSDDDYTGLWWTSCILNSKCGIINLQKEIIVPFIYDYVCFLSPTSVITNKGGNKRGSFEIGWQIIGGEWGTIDLNYPSKISLKPEGFSWDVDSEEEWVYE